MIDDDRDELDAVDLAAWEAPPPPSGLADAVLARAREPAGAVALEPAARRPLHRWMIVAVAAAAAGLVAYLATRGGDDAASSSGFVATAKPSRIALGASAADLDAETDVWWAQDRHRIVAMQPRGTATWTAAAGDTLVIDAGAAVASVEASGASLRVEVQMTGTETRMIGASALTAAAVAMVTVVVYEGQVKVTSADHAVIVPPGGTIEVRPGEPPMEPATVGVRALQAERAALVAELDELRAERAAAAGQATGQAAGVPRRPCDAAALEAEADEALGRGRFKAALGAYETMLACQPDANVIAKVYLAACHARDAVRARAYFARLPIDRRSSLVQICLRDNIDPRATASPDAPATAAVDAVFAKIESTVRACDDGSTTETITAHVTVAPAGGVAAVALAPATAPFASCIASALRTAVFPPTRAGATVSHVYAFASRRSACTKQVVDAAREDANEKSLRGLFAAALATLEPVVRCDASLAVRAYLYACKAHQFPKAKAYFRQVRTPAIEQVCLREGFDPRTDANATLVLATTPAAGILIDGRDLNLRTPASLVLPAGKHQVTFVVGPDRYTFAVTLEDGARTTLHKDLP